MGTLLVIIKFLAGYKTYIAAIGLAALSVYQLTQGEGDQAVQTFLQALVAAGLRSAISTVVTPVVTPAVTPAVTPTPAS